MAQLGTNQSLALTIKGLLQGDSINALNSGNYLSTRISNNIAELRKQGLVIITKKIKAPSGKYFGSYILERSKKNQDKAVRLMEIYKNRTA